MPRGRRQIRVSETRSVLDMGESKPAHVGRLIDNNHMMARIPELPDDKIKRARWLIRQYLDAGKITLEEANMIAAILGLRYRDLGDWPDRIPVDARG